MTPRTDPTQHPRPLLRRAWQSLDGPWRFSLDGPQHLDRTIEVPYAPETPASGIGEPTIERCWYERSVDVEEASDGGRLLVHFGAVDRFATVRAGGEVVGTHEGGYTPFAVDVTDHVRNGSVSVAVECVDDPTDLDAPRGKQDWLPEPHVIWYPRTTGIWRSPWLERVPATRIDELALVGDPKAMTVTVRARVEGPLLDGAQLAVRITGKDRVLVEDRLRLSGREVEHTTRIGNSGIGDRHSLLWWPFSPVLLEVEVALLDADGDVVDEVEAYTALRDVEAVEGSVLLNGRPYPLQLVLDQGYWPDTGATPPDSAALRTDVELTKALGFNGARKHQKTEDPRYLAWADRLGLLVWVEMPSAYRHTDTSAQRLLAEWPAVVQAAKGHPCVMAWVPVNESWGVPSLGTDARQPALVEALTGIARTLDGTRPVSANDGWETRGGQIVGVHDYTQDPEVLRARYADRAAVDAVLTSRRHDGLRADLDRAPAGTRAVVLSEFGGVALADDAEGGAWGYTTASSPEDLLRRYREQWAALHDSDALAGACWTQLTDTYQEVNGLLRADRTPKVPVEDIALATMGIAPKS